MPSGPPWNRPVNKWEHEDHSPYHGGFYADLGISPANWPRMEKKAVGATVIGLDSDPAILVTAKMRKPGSFSEGGKYTIQGSRAHQTNWSRSSTHGWSVTAGLSVTVGAEAGGNVFGASGKVSTSVTASLSATGHGSYGKSHGGSESHMASISAMTGFKENSPDNAALIAQLQGAKGSIQVVVDYECRIIGDCCFWFEQRMLNGRKQHMVPVQRLMDELGLKNMVKVRETLDMGFVFEGEVSLTDALFEDGQYIPLENVAA